MRIYVQTEQLYNWMHRGIMIDCWGECSCPRRITWDKVKDVLERAALPGDGYESYIVVSH